MTISRQLWLAELEVLEHHQYFYASAMEQSEGIHKVYERAAINSSASLELAKRAVSSVLAAPPKKDESLVSYLNKIVLSGLPLKTQYDDVFWCCLLHLLDEKDIPDCAIGGQLHKVIYQVYDDFNPEDVLE